jgi:FixJ family two-component response regulator
MTRDIQRRCSDGFGSSRGDCAMPRSRQGTVIIVEDDPSMSQALERILRLGGFDPLVYGSAEALLDAVGERSAICMILDIQLPGMDGFALHQHLCTLGKTPPVVFITAFDEPDARMQASRADATFLAKPFAGRALLETIRRAVDRASVAGGSLAGA